MRTLRTVTLFALLASACGRCNYMDTLDGGGLSDRRVDAPLRVGPGFFRINPPPGTEGTPDAIWYLGIGRTYGDPARSGTGTERVLPCFTT